jgi:hypothetical protein
MNMKQLNIIMGEEKKEKKIKYAKSLKIYNYISTEELMKQKIILYTVKMVGSNLHDSAIEKKNKILSIHRYLSWVVSSINNTIAVSLSDIIKLIYIMRTDHGPLTRINLILIVRKQKNNVNIVCLIQY